MYRLPAINSFTEGEIKMKVAFVTRSLAGGGAERVVSVLANSFCMIDSVEEVSVISIIEDNITYSISNDVRYYANTAKEVKKINRVIQRYKFLKDTLKTVKPDIIISFCTQINIYSILANIGLGGRLVISERNDPNNDPVQKTVRVFRDIIYRLCRYAVFQTPDAQNYFKNIIKGPTEVIVNPIKDNLPLPYVGEREKRIVSVARLTNVKNHAMLIKAFKKVHETHPEYSLEIYGEGPEKVSLVNLISGLGLKESVHLLGFCEDVHEKILSASCFVLPSNYEGISNAMIEALGLGIPTICTDCPIGGARMMIDNMQNGILVPVNDQKALENAMVYLIENPSVAERMGAAAVKIKEKLSSKSISEEWIKYIDKIMSY